MSYYGKNYTDRPKNCKNYRKGKFYHTNPEAYKNSREKHLHMVPCIGCNNCLNYVFAGWDSGNTPFCYNFEPKTEAKKKK